MPASLHLQSRIAVSGFPGSLCSGPVNRATKTQCDHAAVARGNVPIGTILTSNPSISWHQAVFRT